MKMTQIPQTSTLRINNVMSTSNSTNGNSNEYNADGLKRGARNQVARKVLEHFSTESTIPGVRYFTSEHHWTERVWWVIAVIITVILSVAMIMELWTNWTNDPVTVTFNGTSTSIEEIPFPAITICTSQKVVGGKVDIPKMENLISSDGLLSNKDSFYQMSTNEKNQLHAIVQMCNILFEKPNEYKFPANQSIYEYIKYVAPDNGSVVRIPTWHGEIPQPLELKPILTELGLCFTFNSLNSGEIYSNEIARELLTVVDERKSDWNGEDGYRSDVNANDAYPRRAFGVNYLFDTWLRFKFDAVDLCNDIFPEFQVSVHLPDELPQFDNSVYISPDQSVFLAIKPKMITTSEGLRSYPPKDRGCYFQSERPLRFFRSYSQAKCELECLANYTLNDCGCVRYWMPRDNNTRVCMAPKVQTCCTRAKNKYNRELLVKKCDCLPDCTMISYDVERKKELRHEYYKNIKEFEVYLNRSDDIGYQSSFEIRFKEKEFISTIRSETTTMTKFISECGGLLGLFLGFSALTVAELVYIFTLGWGCKLKREKKIPNSVESLDKQNQIQIMSNQIETISNQMKAILNQIESQRFHCRRRNNSF